MYSVNLGSNYKWTLWFKNKVWEKKHKIIKLSTKKTNLIKVGTNLKKL